MHLVAKLKWLDEEKAFASEISYQMNKYDTSDITSNMVPLLLFGGVGTKGALMLGFTAAGVILHYWNSKKSLQRFTFLVDEFTMGKLVHYYQHPLYLSEKFPFLQQH
jgi:hypothetical protein